MFDRPLAIIDLETTGTDPARDRITEIGLVRIEGGEVVETWSALVDPEQPIPEEIERLTGISNDMVRGQPTFAKHAERLASTLAGHVFVAHNARFDYGFVRNAFARLDRSFSADVLCTVRLARRLEPDQPSQSLDALVARHGLDTGGRHRALGDARLVAALLGRWRQLHGDQRLAAEARRLLRIPSLPPHLPPDCLDGIPDAPGVYVFHGVNELPLYIGKSVSLRTRIRSHFSDDYRTANDARLSAELRRIEFRRTAGELGALLLEARWIKQRRPLLNRAARANRQVCVIMLPDHGTRPTIVPLHALDAAGLAGACSPYANRQAARRQLQSVAAEHGLCWSGLGLEQRDGACFARQLRRCRGLCVGAESERDHRQRLSAALAPLCIPPWPVAGRLAVRESAPEMPTEVHVFDRWCHVGTARDEAELSELASARVELEFDRDVYRMIRAALDAGRARPLGVNPDSS
ncbi:MAG: GIY-YIG nuclease family protein [Burkholderiales bacterium]|nr:MAG: GIY-YIG nuclease family protein [Burkholderiales bacterium]